ncbi:MAG: aminoacyl-tRNA hydrolase [Candidatus Levyibacteriota bacterium]
MKLIIGLGNPGLKYEKTRHNLGFILIEKFLKEFSVGKNNIFRENKKFKAEIAEIEWTRKSTSGKKLKIIEKVILAKPITYMNNSGLSVRLISDFYKIKPKDVWVLHDDLDFVLGGFKIKQSGSSAGHRGIESVIKNLGTEKFWRFRLGVGKPKNNSRLRSSEAYVLREFGHGETGEIRKLIKRGVKTIETALEKGLDVAMNRYNSK